MVRSEQAGEKESEGRDLADGWELYVNSIIKCYDQYILDWALQLSFPFETYCPCKGAENSKLL